MRHATQAKVYQLIVETLQELGIPNAGVSINETTTLVQDGCEVGQSFVCGHVRVIMRPTASGLSSVMRAVASSGRPTCPSHLLGRPRRRERAVQHR